MRFILFFSLLLTLLSINLRADVVELQNGSKISGEVISFSKNKLTIHTDFAGEIKIDASRIISILSDSPLIIETEDGTIYNTTIKKDGYYKITNQEETKKIAINNTPIITIKTGYIVEKDIVEKLEPVEKKWPWDIKLGLNFSTRRYTDDILLFSNTLEMNYRTARDSKFKLYQRSGYSDSRTGDLDGYWLFGSDGEWKVYESIRYYMRQENQINQNRDVKHRNVLASGISHYILNRENIIFRLRYGIGFQYRTFTNDTEDYKKITLDTSLYFKWITKHATFTSEWTWEPIAAAIHQYRLYHETKFEIPLNFMKNTSLQLGVTQEYITDQEMLKDLDTTIFSRFMLTW